MPSPAFLGEQNETISCSTAFRLELEDLIKLRTAGIADSVIQAMLHAK